MFWTYYSAEESVKTGIEKVESRKENNVKFKSSKYVFYFYLDFHSDYKMYCFLFHFYSANDVTLKDIGESSKHLSSQTKGESDTL